MSVNTIINENPNLKFVIHEHNINLSAWHAHIIYCSNEQHIVIIEYRSQALCVLGDSSLTCITAWDKTEANEVVSSFTGFLPDCPGFPFRRWVCLRDGRLHLTSSFVSHFSKNVETKRWLFRHWADAAAWGNGYPSTARWPISALSMKLIIKLIKA